MDTGRGPRGVVWLRFARAALLAGTAATGSAGAEAADPPTAPPAQATTQAPASPTERLLQALQANPVTAPYRFAISSATGRLALTGRVGSRQVHDVAIQTAIALGIGVRDDLVIDTREAQRVAMQGGPVDPIVPRPPLVPSSFYVYPQPLMGRLDDPFYGMEPPLLSYPYGWAPAPAPAQAPAQAPVVEAEPAGPASTIELTVDTRGVAILRGFVPSEAELRSVVEKVGRVPGIIQVVNLLEVDPAKARPRGRTSETPPPPPVPAFVPPPPPPAPRPDPPPPEPSPPVGPKAQGGDALSRLVIDALARRPALAGLEIRVAARDGEVTLSGRVPTAYEAMLAFRAAEQTPGVHSVSDRLAFDLPDIDRPNPLRDKARPEDLAPYLLAHIRRQVGELAHVDRIEVRGDTLEVHGTLARRDDSARVEAALRSIPLLRGFRLTPVFAAE